MFPFIEEFKDLLPRNPTIEDVMSNWDTIKEKKKFLKSQYHKAITGCLLPNQPDVIAGPNVNHFIVRPAVHVKVHDNHPTKSASACAGGVPLPKKSKPGNTIAVAGSSMKSPGIIITDEAIPITVTDKSGTKSKQFMKTKGKPLATIFSFMDRDLGMHDKCKDELDLDAKIFAMDIILTGCQKMVSQRSSIEFYDTLMKGMKRRHEKQFGHITINGMKVKGPTKVSINDNNISLSQKAILDAYMNSSLSPNQALREVYGKYYSIMHDGIQKFSREFNGVHLRTVQLNDQGVEIVSVPWSLSEISGGSLNATKLCIHLWEVMSGIDPPKRSALDSFIQAQKDCAIDVDSLELVLPPAGVFKTCAMETCDIQAKTISLVFKNWPALLMGDGCSTNTSACTALTNMYGLVSPHCRCGVHAGEGSIRRMSKSETYSVAEVVTFLENYRPILRHYKLSGKSTCLLNNALEAMDMNPVHMMVWCPTRMSNMLTCAVQSVEHLFPLCDTLASCDIRKENRDYFMSPTGMIILHMMADLENVFVPQLLRKLDRDQSLIIEVYGASQKFLSKLDDFPTPLLDAFLNGLEEDEHGNLHYAKDIPGQGRHHIKLNTDARPRRGQSKLQLIENESAELREKVTDNLKSNVKDQMQEGTIVEYASCFDLNLPLSKDDRVVLLRELYKLFGTEYTHVVSNDHDQHMTERDDSFFTEWTVTIKYTPKITCSEEEIVTEFNGLWPVLNRNWGKYKDQSNALRTFFQYIIDNYMINFPNICELLLILLSCSPNTSPLERSYSKLTKICYKDRNKLESKKIETLYLLAVHNIGEKNREEIFEKAIEQLEK